MSAKETVGRKAGKAPEAPLVPLDVMTGAEGMIRMGMLAEAEFKTKNRIIFVAFFLLALSLSWNLFQTITRPDPVLLGETTDGRIRPLPTLKDPIFNKKEILGWAERCVKEIYNLSYVDWKESVSNIECLSDQARKSFVQSLGKVGVLRHLNPDMQGVVYAVPGSAYERSSTLTPGGYVQWVVAVPYTVKIDGKERGSLDVEIIMMIRRVSLTWRDDGIWVEKYEIVPRKGKRA